MATPLTWRNVDAPDFRGSLAGLSVAGDSFNRAFGGLTFSLDKFDQYRKDQAESALLGNTARINDPNALKAAMADGSLFAGIDPSLLGRQAYGALDNRVGNLLNQAVTQQGLDTSKQLDPQKIEAARLGNVQTGQNIGFNAQLQPLRMASMALNNQSTALSNDFASKSAEPRLESMRLNNASSRFRLEDDMTTVADKRAAQPYIDQFLQSTNSPEEARLFLNSPEVRNASPGVRMLLNQAASGVYKDTFGPSTATSAPGTAGTRAGSPFDVAFNFTPTGAPITNMPIGEVVNFQRNQLLPTQGASPVGAFQINHATLTDFAPKVLGSEWKNERLTPENQEKIAKAIFEDRKKGDLSQTWASLPSRGVGGYANMSWEEIKPLIAQGEVGNSLLNLGRESRSIRNQATQATTQIATAAAQNQAGTIEPVYLEAMQNNRMTIGEVVDKLSKGIYQGLPRERIVNEINQIMSMPGPNGTPGGKINPALAAALLENNPQGAGVIRRNLPSFLGGYSVVPNGGNLNQDVTTVQRGDVFTAAQQTQQMAATAAAIDNARQSQQAAEAALADVLSRPGMAGRVGAYRARLEMSNAILQSLIERQQRDPTLQPVWDRPRVPAPIVDPNGEVKPAAETPPPRRFPTRDR